MKRKESIGLSPPLEFVLMSFPAASRRRNTPGGQTGRRTGPGSVALIAPAKNVDLKFRAAFRSCRLVQVCTRLIDA